MWWEEWPSAGLGALLVGDPAGEVGSTWPERAKQVLLDAEAQAELLAIE